MRSARLISCILGLPDDHGHTGIVQVDDLRGKVEEVGVGGLPDSAGARGGSVGGAVSDSGGRKAVVQRGVEVGHQASASPERAAAVGPLDLALMRVGGLTFCRGAFEAAFGERVFRCRKGRAPADSWGEGSGTMTEEQGEVA